MAAFLRNCKNRREKLGEKCRKTTTATSKTKTTNGCTSAEEEGGGEQDIAGGEVRAKGKLV